MATKERLTIPNRATVFPWLLIVGAVVALAASFILSLDDLELLKNPSFTPNCNINPVLSCGTVMQTPEASIFGFPNSWIGLLVFASVLTVGVALLAGAKFARWFWLLFKAGMFSGLLFAYWMLLESMFRIHALCPFCLTVDVVTITLNWYLTIYLLDHKLVPVPKRFGRAVDFVRQHHVEILVSWFIVLIAFILQHFWYYYGQFL
jgi:uncharacterized membrane protein